MILEDARDVLLLIRSSAGSGIVGLGLPPFVAFFVVETYDFLRKNRGQSANAFLEENSGRIRDLRSRLKLVAANGGFDEARARFDAIERASSRMFYGGHRGPLLALKRWLQRDLGLFFLNGDLVCTTHVALVNMGHGVAVIERFGPDSLDTLRLELRAFSESQGRFIGEALRVLGSSATTSEVELFTMQIEAEDYKSPKVYDAVRQRLGSPPVELASAFLWLVCHVNYVHRCIRRILSADSSFHFRVRFLAVFYLGQALRTFGALLKGDRASKIGILVAELQSRDGMRTIRRLETLRDALAHYDVTSTSADVALLDTLVQKNARLDRAGLAELLDTELDHASQRFREVISGGVLGGTRVDLKR